MPEWEEWGDPYHDPEVYDYMKSYSPYENIEAKDYPDILAITSLNDTRVLYVEPAKWIAQLRTTATGGEFLLKPKWPQAMAVCPVAMKSGARMPSSTRGPSTRPPA